MNGMRGPSGPLFWAAAACLAALCVLSAAQTTMPTANLNDSSSAPPTPKPTTAQPTEKPSPEPTKKPTSEPTTESAPTQAPAPESCEVHTNCSSCVESKNGSCFWTVCNVGGGYCSENATTPNCTVINNSSNCLVEPTAGPSPTNSTAKPSPATSTIPAVTTVVTSGAPNTTVLPTSSPRKSTFDAASFIGGIVLVLSVQAVVFFLYKFCKSKERNYHTL
ncbi:sialomucin core protein 24 [Dromiciops gliroides]|uniref:sialomucin core protein 24 n=1 Tax=Dromiciops gliroides TaxID=33562 RepID=UPI001CC3F430|nr:sialomucin core protein 24 [Dromiciops gliroides]